MRDMVVVLPGITGSVLRKDGNDVWAPSAGALWRYLRSLGNSLHDLEVPRHDPRTDDPGDDVVADRVIDGFHGVFGLARIDGYRAIRRMILDEFEIEHGTLATRAPANYIEFPYDWRLSNRLNGKRLKALIDERLPLWRDRTGNEDARVILVTHSMGGLVSRWWLEVEEGWPQCRALITFGTPFRGSLNAVGYLANGYKQAFVDLTEVLRSCPAVYELLPTYRALSVDGGYERIAETAGLPAVINADYATAALDFHREIKAAVDAHLEDAEYLTNRYRVYPVVGVAQPTLQSAVLEGDAIRVVRDLPDIDAALDGGDGTVPRVSATPLEYSDEQREIFFGERHSSLQNNVYALDDLRERLKQMQATGLADVHGEFAPRTEAQRPKIGIDTDSLFLGHEPVVITARLEPAGGNGEPLQATVENVTDGGPSVERDLVADGADQRLVLDDLPSGRYRVVVRSSQRGPFAPRPVADAFEVADA